MRQNQKGFTVVVALLSALILTIIGFGGYYVWYKHHANHATNSSHTMPKPYTARDAVNLVQTTYNTYVMSEKQPSGNDALDTIKNNLSDDLYQSLKIAIARGVDSDLIVCAQAIPDKVVANLAATTINDPSVSIVQVLETFGADTGEHPFVAVDLTTHKITNITCSPD